MTRVSWAGDSTRAEGVEPGVVAGLCISRGLRGGFESDVESHCGQVGDVVADLSLGDDAAGVVVGAEVVESGGWVGE
jgi:hypothetical protein